MHNGIMETLDDVVRFYNDGGGDTPNKDDLLQPLNLTVDETDSLVTFLRSLGSDDPPIDVPTKLPPYEVTN
jgi:cytochrome c peroxidase